MSVPYISQGRRHVLDRGVSDPEDVGELTYVLTMALDAYLASGRPGRIRYHEVAACLAALAGAEADLRRRILTPLEQAAQARNGDVWGEDVLRAAGALDDEADGRTP